VTYLCWEGRALSCLDDVGDGSGTYLNATSDGLLCIEAGDPKKNPDGWALADNVIAEEQESFKQKYPHCLPSTSLNYNDASTEEQAMIDALQFYELSDTPLVWQFGYYDDIADDWLYWGEAYGEELPLFIDRYGNVCTNMDTKVDQSMGRVMLAFNDGLFDMAQLDIDDTTSPDDYPMNV